MVSETTRGKVLKAIAELGFVRNESGRHLRAGRSRTIAYLVLDASNPFFTDVAKGVEETGDKGVALYMCNSGGDAAREADYLELLVQQRVRGILITPVDQDIASSTSCPPWHSRCARRPRAGGDWCSVGVDDVEGGELAATHLYEQGHDASRSLVGR